MKLNDFYYDLPEELIAQDPLEDRSASRLMIVDKNTGAVSHDTFKNIASYLNPGDCLVINDTKVIPARLYGVKEGIDISIDFYEGEIIGITLPEKVEYKIIETSEAVKGNTATNAQKDATIETGKVIKVPLFIGEGETILVTTKDGKYAGRA